MSQENSANPLDIVVNAAQPETGNPEQFNPLMGESVIQRSYTGPNINPSDIPEDIPEPTFIPPPFQEITEEIPGTDSEKSFNPEYSELDDKSKKQGAEMMADAILDGYSTATGFLGNVATISQSKLEKEIAEGSIDPSLHLPVDEHTTLSVSEFVTNYNQSASEAFNVDEDFKNTVRPPLVRVLAKRGAAMTDEQFLMYHFGKDLLFKSVAAFQLKSQNNQILTMLRETTSSQKQIIAPAINHSQPNLEIVTESVKKIDTPTEILDYEAQVFSTEKAPQSGFSKKNEVPSNMPSFGDANLLAHMEEAAKSTNNKKPAIKKPTTKKPAAKLTKK